MKQHPVFEAICLILFFTGVLLTASDGPSFPIPNIIGMGLAAIIILYAICAALTEHKQLKNTDLEDAIIEQGRRYDSELARLQKNVAAIYSKERTWGES